MGIVINLSDFNYASIMEPRFKETHQWISWDIHNIFKAFHPIVWSSDFDQLVKFAVDVHNPDKSFDPVAYNGHFQPQRTNQHSDRLAEKANSLFQVNRLRHGFGWAWSLVFHPDNSATFATTFGFVNRDMGPVENVGYKLQREKVTSQSNNFRKTDYYSFLTQEFFREHNVQYK